MEEILTQKIEELWKRARLVNKKTFDNEDVRNSKDEFRLDDSGALIKKSEYGKQTKYGWNIDHILPVSKGGTDHSLNLQVLHWKNNIAKGDDFPTFNIGIGTRYGNLYKNIEVSSPRITFSYKVLEELLSIYPGNQYLNSALYAQQTRPLDYISI